MSDHRLPERPPAGPTSGFGRLVRSRRRALDLTQEDLAQRVGYSVITIRKVESGERRPSRQLAELLARNLSIPAGDGSGSAAPVVDPPGNLPQPLTRLIGRDREVEAVCAEVLRDDSRLVALVGAPGIGKTRLAVQAAADLRHRFASGTFYVPLEPVSDATLVPSAIAKAVGLTEPAGQPVAAALADLLRPWQVLLLLDNLEHLLDAASLVADLLTACPGLTVLATSRAPLRIRGERLLAVPPLAAPQPTADLTAAEAARYPAVQLFTERAQACEPTFALTDANAADVARICTDLDGLPLAVELVAARSRLMRPDDLVARLGDRLGLLTGGPRDLPEHQQTLRGTLDWSFNLLDPDEQALFARLAVFVGGCTLAAAEHVGAASSGSALDTLCALVDKNLIGQEDRAGGERYFVFLRTVREYALERLAARGEEDSAWTRYAQYHLDLAETANAHLSGADQHRWLDRLDASQDNLRAVLQWYAHSGAAAPGLRLVAALWTFWHIRSRRAEGLGWAGRILALPGPTDDRVRTSALLGAGWVALDQGSYQLAGAYFAESLEICRRRDDRHGAATAMHGVGVVAQAAGDDPAAVPLFAESLAIYRHLGDEEGIAWSLDHLGNAALSLGRYAQARERFAESLGIFRTMRNTWGIAMSLHHDGLAAHALGSHELARDRFVESLAMFTELPNGWGIAVSHASLGNVALSTGDLAAAAGHFADALGISDAEHDRAGVARALAGLGSVAVRGGDVVRAACLFAGAQSLAEGSGIRMDPAALRIHEHDTSMVDAVDEKRVREAREAGRTMRPADLMLSIALPRAIRPGEEHGFA